MIDQDLEDLVPPFHVGPEDRCPPNLMHAQMILLEFAQKFSRSEMHAQMQPGLEDDRPPELYV